MIGAILILLFIPFTNTSEIRSTTFRPIFRICFWIFIADFILLTWIGQKPVRNNYIVLGQIATLYYFVFFLFIIPSIGIIECARWGCPQLSFIAIKSVKRIGQTSSLKQLTQHYFFLITSLKVNNNKAILVHIFDIDVWDQYLIKSLVHLDSVRKTFALQIILSIQALKDIISNTLFKPSIPKMLHKLTTTLAKGICSLKRRHKIYPCFFEDSPFVSRVRLTFLNFCLQRNFSSKNFLSTNQLNLRFRFCLQPLNLDKCVYTKALIGFLNTQCYSTPTFLKNIPKTFSITNFKYIDLNNFKSFKSFFILNNIRKENNKFRFLLKNIVANPIFLIYSYKTIINNTNNMTPFELINNITLRKINIHWFFKTSQLIKNSKFKWSYNFNKHVSRKTTELECIKNKTIQKAIYLVLSHLYENKLNYFSVNSYGFSIKKNSHSALHKIKFDWHGINWYLEF